MSDPNPLSLQNVAHFAGNALNSAAFNAGNLIPGVKEYLEDPKYAGAKTAGDVTGLVGSMFLPGGMLVRGLAKGAEAAKLLPVAQGLNKAADFMKGTTGGTKALTNIGRGAAVGLEQAAPRAIVAMTPQGGGESPQDALLQSAIGAGLGGGAGLIGGALSKELRKAVGTGATESSGGWMMPQNVVNKTREDAADQFLSSHFNTSARANREWGDETLRGYGPAGKGQKMQDAKQEAIDYTQSRNIQNMEDLKAHQGLQKEAFQLGAQKFEESKSPFLIKGDPAKADSKPTIPSWIANYPGMKVLNNKLIGYLGKDEDSASIIQDLLSKVQAKFDDARSAGIGGVDAVQGFLTDLERANFPANTNIGQRVQGMIAGTIKDAMQEEGFNLASKMPEFQRILQEGQWKDLADLKDGYRKLGIFRYNQRLQDSQTLPAIQPNSDTQMKNALMQGFANLAPGAALGAGVGGASQGMDFSNPATLPAIMGGAVAGGLGGRALAGATNKIIGQGALKLNQALQNPESIPTKAILGTQSLLRGQNPLNQVAQNLPAAPGKLIQPAVAQAPAIPANQPVPQAQPLATTDPNGNPIPMTPPLPQGPKYQQVVDAAIRSAYKRMFMPLGSVMQGAPTPQEFANEIGKVTSSNGIPFDPSLMAKMLVPGNEKEQDNFVRSYQKVQQIGALNIQKDLLSKAIPVLGGVLSPAEYQTNLQKVAMAITQPEQGGNYDSKKMRDNYNAMDSIIKGWGSPAQKEGLIRQLIQTSIGPTVNNLAQFGLLDNTILGGM